MNTSSKYYIMKKYGGYSPCIAGNDEYHLRPEPGSVLPNCVGFVVGYANEDLEEGSCRYLGSWKPSYFLTGAKKQGLKTGSKISARAIAVWEKHVAYVLQVNDQFIALLESNYYYTKKPIVRTVKYKAEPQVKAAHEGFRGYIYLPEKAPVYTEYVVKAGDTLSKIARKCGVSMEQILADNPIIKNKNLIKVGWKLKIRRSSK